MLLHMDMGSEDGKIANLRIREGPNDKLDRKFGVRHSVVGLRVFSFVLF